MGFLKIIIFNKLSRFLKRGFAQIPQKIFRGKFVLTLHFIHQYSFFTKLDEYVDLLILYMKLKKSLNQSHVMSP